MKRILLFVIFIILVLGVSAQSDSCSYNNVFLKDTFYKAHNGIIYDTGVIFFTYNVDTIYIGMDTIYDSTAIKAINICLGDELILGAYGTYDSVRCIPCDSSSTFHWYFGNGDTMDILGVNFANITYTYADCYGVVVKMTDSSGCGSKHDDYVQVRISKNPIRQIFTLPNICQYEQIPVNVGYDNNSNIQLNHLENIKVVTKTNDVKTFIPDGPNCPVLCYEAPVNFTEFPAGRTVESSEDICSVCINFEHSYMGDYRLTLKCPNGQKAILKYGSKCYGGSTSSCDTLVNDSTPAGSYGGGSQYTGIPYGGSSDFTWDNLSNNYCDSIYNMYGEGYDYCFSRNSGYQLASGNIASIPNLSTDDYIASTNPAYTINISHTFSPIPSPYMMAGNTAQPSSFRTKLPSDHENKLNYYAPAEDFSSLIGCPLNGDWSIEVCDFWGQDNGWVFSWNMDICGMTQNECDYEISLDTVIWHADDNLNFTIIDSATAFISSDTFGVNFPVYMSIHDNFGCVWDTNTSISVTHTPNPNIGPDLSLCPNDSITLYAFDGVAGQNYSYLWSTGETTDSIILRNNMDKLYIVEVVNDMNGKFCSARDSLNFTVFPHPLIRFDANKYPMEGCEPFSVIFTNETKSITLNNSYNIHHNLWDFGDGTYSTAYSPVHVFQSGQYTVKYYAESYEGCSDSMIFPRLITVFDSPHADFTWEPEFGIVNKDVSFINRTSGSDNTYRWEYRYSSDFPYSWNTLTDENPSIGWSTPGLYPVRLIAFKPSLSPSGRIFECRDTMENTITVIDDILRFPNVVTPNNDGINDRFVIQNLIEGMAFPINSLYIYNRWGILVYHKENISGYEDFWHPVNEPAGSYFYRFTGKGYTGNIEHCGVIELLR